MIKIERTLTTLPNKKKQKLLALLRVLTVSAITDTDVNGKVQELLALLREHALEVQKKTLRQQLGRKFPGVPVEITDVLEC